MIEHEGRLVAFLAGELDETAERQFDEHLLTCECCWQAVREDRLARDALERTREQAPPDLADRIRFTVELADRRKPEPRAANKPPRRRVRWAGAGLLAIGFTIATVLLLPRVQPADPAPVATVVRAARQLPLASEGGHHGGGAVPLGPPVRRVVEGTRLALTYYRVDGFELVRAIADHPFPEPVGARQLNGMGMAWVAVRGELALYCPNASHSTLVVGRVSVEHLKELAHQLPPP